MHAIDAREWSLLTTPAASLLLVPYGPSPLLRLHNECLAQVKALLRKRDPRPTSVDEDARDHHAMAESADHAHGWSSGNINSTAMHTSDKLFIWNHDAERTLAIGSEVAALVDAHSEPPLWIQCVITGYRPGPVSAPTKHAGSRVLRFRRGPPDARERPGEARASHTLARACVFALFASSPFLLFLQRPKYEVLDLDTGESTGDGGSDSAPVRQKRYVLDARKILPLPTLVDVPLHRRREFVKGERVIAVFPTSGITTLYPAEVVLNPRKRKNATYLLAFDDDEDVHRSVNAQYVAPLVEMPEDS